MRGWIYVISNPGMPGLVKIGYSTRDSETRAAELNSTGAAHNYLVEYDVLAENPAQIEKELHSAMAQFREGREWFRCTPEFAVSILRQVIADRVIVESYKRVDRAKAAALQEQHERERIARQQLEEERKQRESEIRERFQAQIERRFPETKLVVWMIGVFFVAVATLGATGAAKSDVHLLGLSLFLGAAGGFIAHRWHRNTQWSSSGYRSILEQRDQELASVRRVILKCPQCGQMLRAPAGKDLEVTCAKCRHAFHQRT